VQQLASTLLLLELEVSLKQGAEDMSALVTKVIELAKFSNQYRYQVQSYP